MHEPGLDDLSIGLCDIVPRRPLTAKVAAPDRARERADLTATEAGVDLPGMLR